MNLNEENLNNSVKELHKDLFNITNSVEYKLGRKICKISLIKKILEKKLNKCNLPVKESIITEMYVTDDKYPDLSKNKVAIYTCITGDYDNVIEPMYCNSNVDYILFTNNKKLKSDKWQVKYIDNKGFDNVLLNRYVKMHPSEYLDKYDYSIYVDGNIKIYVDISCYVEKLNKKHGLALSTHSARNKLSDEVKACKMLKKGNEKEIDDAVKSFFDDGMPDDYGLLEAPVIVTDIKNQKAKKILNEWWEEFYQSNTRRDQIILPYILWKNKIKIEEIGTLSQNIWLDAKIEKVKHNKFNIK